MSTAGIFKPEKRNRLPNRRQTETLEFFHDGLNYSGSVSRYPGGTVGEVFLDAAKISSTSGILARDCAIAASLAFQYGCTVQDLRDALTRSEDGSAAGPLAKFLDLIGEAAP